jgi:hypothetical protein
MVNSRIEFDACGSTAADVSFSLDNSRLTASGSIILGTVTELNDGESWGLNLENVPRDARGEFELRWIWQGLCRWLNFARWSIQFLLPEEHENEDFFLLPDELARAVFDTVLYTFCHESYERLSFEKFQASCNALSWQVPEVDREPDLTGGEFFELVLALRENRKLCKIRLSRPLPVRPPYINESGRSSSASVFEASGEESENESICDSDCSECFSDQASRNRSENGSMQGSKSGVGRPPRLGSRASSGNSRRSDSRSGSEDSSNGERQAYWMTTLGMCYPKRVKVGDVAVIVRGCKHPLLIREKENRYEIISELYLHGVMYGEAVGIYPETDIEFI